MRSWASYLALGELRVALALMLVVLAIYLSTTVLAFHSIDEVAVFSVARSLVGRGTFDADIIFWVHAPLGVGSVVAHGLDGHTYSIKDVAPSILAAPLVWLAHLAGVSPVRTALFLSPLVSAMTAGLVYLVARSWGYGKAVGVLGGLVYGLATMAWPYAETLFTQPLAALGLLVAIWGGVSAQMCYNWRAALIGGLGLGLAGVSTVPAWISAPVYLLYLVPWESIRDGTWRSTLRQAAYSIIGFGVGAGLFALLQAVYNLARFGSPLATGHYQVGAANIRLGYLGLGSFGQLLSTPRGLVWYAPFVVLVPVGVAMGWRTHRRPLLLAIGQVGAIFLLYSSYATWWAGMCWGPRFLVAVMPALTLLIVPLLDHLVSRSSWWVRILVSGVLLFSAATQLLASAFDYLESEPAISHALHLITPPDGFVVRSPVLTDVSGLPQVRQIVAAQHGQWDILWMSRGHPDWPLMGGLVVVITLATVWLTLALTEKGASRLVGLALIGQVALTVALVVGMLWRYPQGPDEVTGLDELAATLSTQIRPGDGIITLLPYSYLGWIDSYDGTILDIGLVPEAPLSEESTRMLEQAVGWHSRLWMVSEGTVGGDPGNGVELWLTEHGFVGSEAWVGGFRMVPYTFPTHALTLRPMHQGFGDSEIALVGFATEQMITPDEGWLNVWLRWEVITQPTEDYTVFVHVLDEHGMLVTQHDGWPMAGYAPTSIWRPGDLIDDRHSVALPLGLPPGEYQLMAGLYHALSGERLPLADGTGDSALLGVLEIGPEDGG